MANKDSEKAPQQSAPWQAFSDLSRWEREIERLFDDFFDRRVSGQSNLNRAWPRAGGGTESAAPGDVPPALDLFDDGPELVAKLELPGFEKQDIDVSITEDVLTVTAEKKKPEEIKTQNYYRVERVHGPLRRSIDLPKPIETERVRASFKNGVLEIRMPRSAIDASKASRVVVE